jgi:hypothetical protein
MANKRQILMPEAPPIKEGFKATPQLKNDPPVNLKKKTQSQDFGNQHSEDYLKYGPHRGNNPTSANKHSATTTVKNATDKSSLSGSDSHKPITVDKSTVNNKGTTTTAEGASVFNFASAAILICGVSFLIWTALSIDATYRTVSAKNHPTLSALTDSKPSEPHQPLASVGQNPESFSNTPVVVTSGLSSPLLPAPPKPISVAPVPPKPVPAFTPNKKNTLPKESNTQANKNESKEPSIYDWIKLAEQDDLQAQSQLGHMYANAEGTPRNYDEAVRWNFKAAKSGSARAQSNLGVAYGNGQGVPSDAIEAYAWWYLAAKSGSAAARSNMKKFDKVFTDKQRSQAIERSKVLATEIRN